MILVEIQQGHTRTCVLKGWLRGILSLCLLGAPMALGYFGYQLALSGGSSNAAVKDETTQAWEEKLRNHSRKLDLMLEESQREIEALTLRLAMLQLTMAQSRESAGSVTGLVEFKQGTHAFDAQDVTFGGATIDARISVGFHPDRTAILFREGPGDELQQLAMLGAPQGSVNDHTAIVGNIPAPLSGYLPVTFYKNGRVVDPAAYLHRTAR